MNMVEKVARAIHETNRKPGQALFDDCNETYKNLCLIKARAAIEAMREPTEEMICCAKSQFALFADEYRRAIDAALKE